MEVFAPLLRVTSAYFYCFFFNNPYNDLCMSTISIEKRTERGHQLEELRRADKVPAVFYGPKDESEAISIPRRDFEKILKSEGESSVITLKGDGVEKDVLIHEMQLHPITHEVQHIDFYVIDKTKKVEVSVPIEFEGEAPAVKNLGGILVRVLHELEIEVLPTEIPQHISVDVSVLTDFESVIHAGDVVLPEGVTLLTGAEEAVALTEEPREEEPEEPAEEASIEDIERVGEKEEEAEEASE